MKPNGKNQANYNPGSGQNTFFKDENSVFVYIKNLSDPENGFKELCLMKVKICIMNKTAIHAKNLSVTLAKSGDAKVKLQNKTQSDILLKATKLETLDINIKVTEATHFNSSKCIVRTKLWDKFSTEHIMIVLNKASNEKPKCTNIYRVTRQTPKGPETTNTYILTFASPYPPRIIDDGTDEFETIKYIQNPFQCKKCFKLNDHSTKACPNKDELCPKCKLFHKGPCKEHKCINCTYDPDRTHKENDPDCPEWCYAYEINFCMANDRIHFRAAKRIVDNLIREGPYSDTILTNVFKNTKNNGRPKYQPSYADLAAGRAALIGKPRTPKSKTPAQDRLETRSRSPSTSNPPPDSPAATSTPKPKPRKSSKPDKPEKQVDMVTATEAEIKQVIRNEEKSLNESRRKRQSDQIISSSDESDIDSGRPLTPTPDSADHVDLSESIDQSETPANPETTESSLSSKKSNKSNKSNKSKSKSKKAKISSDDLN